MLIGRHDIEKLMRCEPASACLPNPFGQSNLDSSMSDVDFEVEMELSDLLLSLRPIKQVLYLEAIVIFFSQITSIWLEWPLCIFSFFDGGPF